MEKRTLNGLNLTDEDYIFAGNLTIDGDVVIKNGHLVVSGHLEIINAKQISIDGDISAGSLTIGSFDCNLAVIYGDIFVAQHFYISHVDLKCNNINILGNSNMGGNIHCLNFLINGDNESFEIEAEEDIYIMGSNYSASLIGRDIFINGDCNFNDYTSKVSRDAYIGGKIISGFINCSSLNVGN